MRFRFQAVDSRGRVVREIMRADNEEEAREILLDEELFPKSLEPVGEDEKVTWVARDRVKRRAGEAAARATETAPRVSGSVPHAHTTLHRGNESVQGLLGVREDDTLLFQPDKSNEATIVLTPDRVEDAQLSGFPLRQLRVFQLDGELLEFPAGFLFSGPIFRRITKTFGRKKAKKAAKGK
ncbi:hypothetical protein KQI84_11135 [bacterium]|nr:hypothetical protein [bacterium]